MKRVMIIGATSGIAKALARNIAAQGSLLYLAGRDDKDLEHIAADLSVRYGTVAHTGHFDADDFKSHPSFVENGIASLDGLDTVVVCLGYLGDQEKGEKEFGEAAAMIDRNFKAVVSLLTPIANYMAERKKGTIIVLASVAGDRGRQSNYLYGAAKAGTAAFLQGLRNRLAKANVHVLTVKPGFVDTSMTYGLKGMFLVADPERMAGNILRAAEKKKEVIYTPWFWRWIMLIIRSIPERIFKRLSL